jgi:hypothetical protein
MRARREERSAAPGARAFAVGRARAIARLERGGLPARDARAWIEAWDLTTTGLDDFRRSADFWELGRQYALEEWKRGYAPPDLFALLQSREAS